MSDSRTRTPTATLRKEVVETATFGEVLVVKLMASERLELFDLDPVEGEEQGAFTRRVSKRFTPRLLHMAARRLEGEPMYSETDWDIQLSEFDDELKPVVRKALAMNGFPVTVAGEDGKPVVEDAAKNG